jgi:release factor glutamine methyltransferase
MPAEAVNRIRQWHERAYLLGQEASQGLQHLEYLGLSIVVPPQVMPITPTSHLLGEVVLAETTPGDRVLDMGTGSGVNALLAATKGAHVIAVDNNPLAIDAARANAVRNGLDQLIEFRRSDVFTAVDEVFDLVIFDPPFRWFAPRNLFETAITDENYATMRRFFGGAKLHLAPEARMLIFFGTSGDLDYLKELADWHGFTFELVARDDLEKDGWRVDYFTFKVALT